MKRVLISRFGGLGDLAPISAVCKQFKKQGWDVTLATRYGGPEQRSGDMFINSPDVDRVLDLVQVGPWNSRCIKTPVGFVSLNSIFEDFDLVLDYMNCIENNNTSPVSKDGIGENRQYGMEWQASRNSNWVNWYDLHLSWANINPADVADTDKRPSFSVTDEEIEPFKLLKQGYSHLITLQTSASSISRTWNQSDALIPMLLKRYPEALVASWDARSNIWTLNDRKGRKGLPVPSGISPIRFSMGLVAASDVYVGADTGFTHVAEALGVKHVAIYSTVPAWTRAKYYENQVAIDPGKDNSEYYTFSLALGDPLNVLEGEGTMSDREKLVAKLFDKKVPVEIAAKELNCDVEGADLALNALIAKRKTFERIQSKALSSVSAETVFNEVTKILKD